MAKRPKRRDDILGAIRGWSDSRTVELLEFSPIHKRLTDDFTSLDIWPTTGRYWVGQTNYNKQTEKRIVERGGEKGTLPAAHKLGDWLDDLFFAVYR